MADFYTSMKNTQGKGGGDWVGWAETREIGVSMIVSTI